MLSRTRDGVREISGSKAWTEKWHSAEIRIASYSYGVTVLHSSFLPCSFAAQGFLQLSSHSFWSHLAHLLPQYLHCELINKGKKTKKPILFTFLLCCSLETEGNICKRLAPSQSFLCHKACKNTTDNKPSLPWNYWLPSWLFPYALPPVLHTYCFVFGKDPTVLCCHLFTIKLIKKKIKSLNKLIHFYKQPLDGFGKGEKSPG